MRKSPKNYKLKLDRNKVLTIMQKDEKRDRTRKDYENQSIHSNNKLTGN